MNFDDLQAQIRAARTPLRITGHGSKDFYGEAPAGEVLSTLALNGITAYEPSELYLSALAGTPIADVETALAAQRQRLAFEPPRFGGRGTVGGMVAAGLSGPSRAALGSVRDHVLGAVLINGNGELLSFGGTVMKNVAGFDISRVLAGSMGQLGLITEVTLKVLPLPAASATLRFDLDQPAALKALNAWGGQPLPIEASAWWDGALLLRLAGAAAAVEAACRRLGGDLIPADLAEPFWTGLRDQGDEFFVGAARAVAGGARLWRLSVPSTAPELKLHGEQLIEWGGAQRWVVTPMEAAAVREAAAGVGGHATLFRALDKSPGAFAPLAAPLAAIHRRLKAAFDPHGVFNPGRLYAGL
ncbi:glycolate oxidase subunit GlcE [Roseateles saccharophilus]|uniref:Glycolate oxidase FAD binding subunit n=1 Tax=Roseateles saccharophilus TaxID=304 RepID=A0A4R3UYS0_ROSSA|nr:glycolate oxidase subunit GlcE [Roseateles saccharophilus]MDG0835397.1 glycolate oxidase subunit GlcE [Roseateles saccharophilus]TCU96231.1 glycolate oxidase FAD binding subunit [Roseateles saccharophilus]